MKLQNRTLAGSGAKPMAAKREKPLAFGWRARIGYLCPSVFELIAHDFYRIAHSGVGLIGVTCMIHGFGRLLRKIGG